MKFATALVASLINTALGAWLIMLLLGLAHSEDARVPALSYGVTLALAVAVSIATFRPAASE